MRRRRTLRRTPSIILFFFHDTAPTEIYTLSLHDALPILIADYCAGAGGKTLALGMLMRGTGRIYAMDISAKRLDRKSTRLNSSHGYISYAVFCLKKKTPRPRCRPP